GVNVHGNPVGFQLQGKEFQDAELLAFAHAFDAVAEGRVLPSITPALAYDPTAPAQVVSPLPALPLGSPASPVPGETEPPTEEPTEPPVEEPTTPPVEEPTTPPVEEPT